MVAHISSSKRMESIFMVNDVCCSEYTLHGAEYYSECGKVAVSYGGKEIIGYITDENEDQWTIILQNNNVIEIDRVMVVVFNKGREQIFQNYKYKNVIIGNIVNPVIVQYCPILVRVDMYSMQNMI